MLGCIYYPHWAVHDHPQPTGEVDGVDGEVRNTTVRICFTLSSLRDLSHCCGEEQVRR